MAITKLVADSLGAGATPNQSAFKNIIINGDMSIAQRGTSVSSITTTDYYTVDRWKAIITTIGTWTMSQDTDVPSGQGFANSLKMDCTTADASPASGDIIRMQHRIEGKNLQYLKKGTSNAESTTVSFWVKSNKTGTYIVELYDVGNARQISKSYTIDSASTWEKKTITFAGDTTGAIDNDNTAGLQFGFYLGAGSNYTSGTLNTSWNSVTTANRAVGQVNLADSTANEWYITGVQLEAGTTASDFEFLPYDINKYRCQRYYYLLSNTNYKDVGVGGYYNSSQIFVNVQLPTCMRSAPTLDQVTGTNHYSIFRQNTADDFNSLTIGAATENIVGLYNNSEVSGTAGDAGFVRTNDNSPYIAFTSEL